MVGAFSLKIYTHPACNSVRLCSDSADYRSEKNKTVWATTGHCELSPIRPLSDLSRLHSGLPMLLNDLVLDELSRGRRT